MTATDADSGVRICPQCEKEYSGRSRRPLCWGCWKGGVPHRLVYKPDSVDPELPRSPDEQIADLRASLRRAHLALGKARAHKSELVRAVREAAHDAAASLDLPHVPAPTGRVAGEGSPEVAISLLSDWQLAKVTPSYNSEVCERRVGLLADKVRRLADIQRADHPVREARVYLLGDMIEGELIFPGQAHLIDASLYRQVVETGPRILGSFVRAMLADFDRVRVVGVVGNHGSLGGRARRDYHPESNADAMMYDVTRQIVTDPRLEWEPTVRDGERAWYAVDYVGDHGFLLFHGDQVKGGFAGFPWYGFAKKLLGWRIGGVPEPFTYAASGHFHTPVRFYLNGLTLFGNGSTESSNTYAAEELSSSGEPCQQLLFCHPRRGVTADYVVKLDQ